MLGGKILFVRELNTKAIELTGDTVRELYYQRSFIPAQLLDYKRDVDIDQINKDVSRMVTEEDIHILQVIVSLYMGTETVGTENLEEGLSHMDIPEMQEMERILALYRSELNDLNEVIRIQGSTVDESVRQSAEEAKQAVDSIQATINAEKGQAIVRRILHKYISLTETKRDQKVPWQHPDNLLSEDGYVFYVQGFHNIAARVILFKKSTDPSATDEAIAKTMYTLISKFGNNFGMYCDAYTKCCSHYVMKRYYGMNQGNLIPYLLFDFKDIFMFNMNSSATADIIISFLLEQTVDAASFFDAAVLTGGQCTMQHN